MKNLYESLLDDFNTISKSSDKSIKEEIRAFLNKHYMGGTLGDKCKISKNPDVDGKYIVDITARNIQVIQKGLTHLTNSYFKFGTVKVKQSFTCHLCNDLLSLEGAPRYIEGNFICYGCPNLTSLEGAPEIVSGDFTCYDCKNLKSIIGIPKEVDGTFVYDDPFTEQDIRKYCDVKKRVIKKNK